MLIVIGALVSAVVGLVTLRAHAGPSPEPSIVNNPALEVFDIPAYDFDANPLGDVPGAKVSSVTEPILLTTETPVPVVLPKTVGAIPDMYITDPSVQADWQLVVLNYKSSAYGQVQIFERAEGLTQEGIDQWAEPGYCTSCTFAESVVLAGGQRAAVLGTPGSTTVVHWIQKGVQIDVMGPFSTLSRDDAVAVANDLSVQ
jgi:hypothetical protein